MTPMLPSLRSPSKILSAKFLAEGYDFIDESIGITVPVLVAALDRTARDVAKFAALFQTRKTA